jgi:hypothetical protein
VVNVPIAAERLRLGAAHAASGREPRRVIDLEGFAAVDSGTTFRVRVLDLSYDGCRIEAPIALLPGLKLKLAFPALGACLEAAVQWCRDGSVGLLFHPGDLHGPAIQQTPAG